MAVVVNRRLSAREIDQIREHCGARRVIYTTSVSPHAREHAKRNGAGILDVKDIGAVGLGPWTKLSNRSPLIKQRRPHCRTHLYFRHDGPPKRGHVDPSSLLFVAAVSAKIRSLAPEDRLLGVLPMSHAVGLSVCS